MPLSLPILTDTGCVDTVKVHTDGGFKRVTGTFCLAFPAVDLAIFLIQVILLLLAALTKRPCDYLLFPVVVKNEQFSHLLLPALIFFVQHLVKQPVDVCKPVQGIGPRSFLCFQVTGIQILTIRGAEKIACQLAVFQIPFCYLPGV